MKSQSEILFAGTISDAKDKKVDETKEYEHHIIVLVSQFTVLLF